MKRVNEYRKLFNADKDTDLKQLKRTYRNLVKEWHPDKFQENDPLFEQVELKSRQIIDGYHFLVSIAPETKATYRDEYLHTTSKIGISNYNHKGLFMEVEFLDGSKYEYFGVNGNMFQKFLNADKQIRFARRNIFSSYLYRKAKKAQEKI